MDNPDIPDLDALVNRINTLLTLPDIYARLVEAVNHPHTSFEDIGNILVSDISLTARLLRIANSALFNFPSKVDSISRAVTIIGTEQLRDLVLATTVTRLFRDIPLGTINMRSFWEHGVACGIVARNIATYRRESNFERFYVSGLLHDVGLLVLIMELPDVMSALLSNRDESEPLFYEREQAVFGYDHAEVGSALLKMWRIPQSIHEPTAYHHRPQLSQHYPLESAVVHVADIIVHCLSIGGTGEHCIPPLDPVAWTRLNIPEQALVGIIELSERQFDEVVDELLAED
ncbi:MAG TPA: HDOD domain-containing protein [Acidiferrobacteraceae bacterium]|nr:HDOD domain-containing protein [Acidiferrobacteraceae bacterium]